MTADLNSPLNTPATANRGRISAAGLLGALALASGLASGAAPAMAESVLAMHIEEQTSWVQNFNPFDLGGRRQSTMDFVYEPLVIFNDYDSGKPIFRLATAYKFSDDLKSITYTLRDGVKWSDGQPLTSADMKYTLELMLKNPAVDIVGVGESVASVEAPSPTEVKINAEGRRHAFPGIDGRFPGRARAHLEGRRRSAGLQEREAGRLRPDDRDPPLHAAGLRAVPQPQLLGRRLAARSTA